MPLARYEIRNEYRLSDPEVYRAADKDDPEALLEGVAMAGLIGVLRQLGDLADFAAVIFHDLHEEVMATAARGHGLMVRVQQLEMEFPSIEKAFLSQTSHMHFAHSAGLDYHSSVRMDQNLVTQGDLPRFVMDSYEECRGPPRLFLLDKFDVAGAGACLKRYSDPSSFKMELSSSETRKSDEAHREKRARKSKKKGLRLRNGEAPDILSASHGSSKLYHLFATSDEQNQIPTNTPTHDLKLKPRQFIGSPFSNPRTRKSYMEPVLEIQLPECSVKTGDMKSNEDEIEMGIENSSIMLLIEERIHISSPDRQREAAGSPCDLNNNVIEEKNVVSISRPISEFIEEKIPSTYSHMDLKDVLVDGESKMEGSANGDVSDDMASELENYMDALTTMESEIETDSEYRSKHETRFNVEHQRMDSDKNEEQQELPIHSSDSLSIANSVASCDWNGSSRKGRSSFSNSDALSNCADLQPSQVTETTSTDLPANPQLLGLDDAVSSSVYDNPCFESVENASSLGNKILPAENVDINSETVLKNNRVLGAKSPEFLDLYESSSASNSVCLRSNMPDHKLGRSHSTETFPYCLEDSKDEEETPHNCAESRKTEEGSLCCLEVSKSEDEISPSCLEVSKSEKEISSSHVGVSKADPVTSSSSEEACKDEKEISPGFAEVLNHQKETSFSSAETDEEAFPVNEEGSKAEEATSRIEEVSNHSGSDLPNISDLPSGTNDATALENLVPGEYCKDGSAVENSQSNTLGSPCSVAISPELHFQGLFEQNPDSFPDVENFVHPDEKSEDLSSIVDLQQISDFSEYEITIPTSGMQLVELEHFSEADISSNSHWHNSGMMDFAESAVGSPRTGAKLLSNNLEVLPNSQLEASSTDNDFPEAPIDDIKFTEESLSSSAAPSQQELKVLEDHLDRNGERITAEEDILENTRGPCINKPTVNTNDSEPSNPDPAELPSSEFLSIVHPVPHTEHAHLPLLSNDDDSRESDQYSEFKALSTDNLSGVGNPLEEASMVESRKESGALSLPQGGQSCESSGLHFERLQVSEAMEHAHLPLLSNDEDSRESDQYSEFKALSTDNLSGVGNPLEEASMVESRKESGALSLPKGGQSCESSGLHFERFQVSEAMDTTHFSNDANSSPVDLLGQQSETKIELHSNPNMLGNKFIVYEESVSSPAIEPEVAMLSSQGSDTSSLELLNVTKLSPFVSDKNESSVPLQLLEFSLPHSSAVDARMEEMPPLPPLPPLQWRVGKSRPLFFMGEAEPPNSLDVSPSTEDEHNCQGGEVAMPSNLSYTLPTIEFEQTNGDLPSKHKDNLVEPPNLLTTENDEHNSLEGEMMEPMNGDLPSKHNDPLVDPPNLLTTGNGEQNSLEGEMMEPTNGYLPSKHKDTLDDPPNLLTAEKDEQNSLEGEMMELTNGYLPSKHKDTLVDPPNLRTAENDEQNSLEGEMMEPSKLSVISPTIEDDGLNDVLPSQQSRPKNPLIEALASHDKSTLRRASDRVRFKSRPKMDEREVLLEQIRAKSFSLKPTVSMMKPSIQGPATNFKVAAILEKAKAIRQAFAGSDEDDGDNWSDA